MSVSAFIVSAVSRTLSPKAVPQHFYVCPICFGLFFREQEVRLNWSKWVRQIHRWLSIAFTVAVIVTFVVLQQEKPPVWVNFLPLPPLFLLLFTGLYLFALPYATKWRSGRRTD